MRKPAFIKALSSHFLNHKVCTISYCGGSLTVVAIITFESVAPFDLMRIVS
jgi:hypothetical protein